MCEKRKGELAILQGNRAMMAREAKRAAKLEKKLKVLMGGYMVSEGVWSVYLGVRPIGPWSSPL